jgi:holo-[acyl-carrier protein] synthase
MAKVGIDIASISRFQPYTNNTRDGFITKNFSEEELAYCFSYADPTPHLAGTFAAKEAINKAFNGKYMLSAIEIRRSKKGVPEAWHRGRKFKVALSIAHEENMAIAVALG